MQSFLATGIGAFAIGAALLLPSPARPFCFEEAGVRYNVPPELLQSISKKENPNQDPAAVNYNTDGSYDYGLMQINTCHAEDLLRVGIPWESLADPCTNVMVGAWFLSQRIQEYGYNWKAIGAYHSKTPSKRDRYARDVAKILKKTPTPVVRQQAQKISTTEHSELAWGKNNGTVTP